MDFTSDLVVSNIHYDVMKNLIRATGFLKKKRFILSGLMRSEAARIASTLADLPVEMIRRWDQDGIWHTFYGAIVIDAERKKGLIMVITCWGSRGSIPVSGKEYIKYGGDTTCMEIRTESDDIIIVDAGTGIRRLGNHLIDQGRYRYNFLLTHGHWDHLMGFPFFKPLFLSRDRNSHAPGAVSQKIHGEHVFQGDGATQFPGTLLGPQGEDRLGRRSPGRV